MNQTSVMRRSMGTGTPGVHLRQAREARRLGQQDVALQLRLGRHVIDAIENDDYRKLPGQIFVRGYLRAYARLLDLSEEEIIQAFNHLDVAQSELAPLTPTYTSTYVGADEKPTTIQSNSAILRWFVCLAVLLMVIMLVKWFIIENPSINVEPHVKAFLALFYK
jgi:cytoskeleton protein RodZ